MNRRILMALCLLFALLSANLQVAGLERLRQSGLTMLAPLAPVDPRSLMQGDYMRLGFDDSLVGPAGAPGAPPRGRLVVTLDSHGVATGLRLDAGEPLTEGAHLLAYQRKGRWRRPVVGADSFFFAEGAGDRYRGARYAILKVAPDGKAALTGLADEHFREIQSSPAPGRD